MTDALVTILHARLDEDEQVARAAHAPNWSTDGRRGLHYGVEDGWMTDALTTSDADHIARQNPARILREVEAKRRIAERHSPHSMGSCRTCERPHWGVQVCNHCERAAPCPDLRDLATVYADHPDYLAEWRP
ncbi:DUF6221 family protein [Streptomyces halstedii]|uniref:DUF6221 family protein n=1 Tax=Streptomyces halstedii TaxID=1944 RepID=UPI00380AFCD7